MPSSNCIMMRPRLAFLPGILLFIVLMDLAGSVSRANQPQPPSAALRADGSSSSSSETVTIPTPRKETDIATVEAESPTSESSSSSLAEPIAVLPAQPTENTLSSRPNPPFESPQPGSLSDEATPTQTTRTETPGSSPEKPLNPVTVNIASQGIPSATEQPNATSSADHQPFSLENLPADVDVKRLGIAAMPEAATLTPNAQLSEGLGIEPYRFRLGDQLSISVWEEPSLDQKVAVLPDGTIMCKLIGPVVAENRTISDLTAEITSRLEAFMLKPEVTIIPQELREIGSYNVVLLGAVTFPGRYELQRGDRILDIVAQAQGLVGGDDGRILTDTTKCTLTRKGRFVDVDFSALLIKNDPRCNILLENDDVIHLPPRTITKEVEIGSVSVLGKVGSPGFVAIQRGMTILDVLIKTGASVSEGDWRKAYLLRDGVYHHFSFPEFVEKRNLVDNVVLNDGDFIYVPDFKEFVLVIGAVTNSGKFLIKEGDRVLDAIGLAGGLAYSTEFSDNLLGNLKASYMVRDEKVLDINFHKLLREGEVGQNILVQDGDFIYIPEAKGQQFYIFGEVRQPQAVALTQEISLIEALSLAGGPTPIGVFTNQVFVFRGGVGAKGTVIQRNLQDLLFRGHVELDFLLEQDDIVYVPEVKISKWGRYTQFVSRWLDFILEVNSFPDDFRNRTSQ